MHLNARRGLLTLTLTAALLIPGPSAAKGLSSRLRRATTFFRTHSPTQWASYVLGNSRRNVPRATDSVVLLQRQLGSSTTGVGSGFVFESSTHPGKRLIMTNHHVIKNVAPGEQVVVGFARGDVPIKARVLGSNDKADVAVLEPLGKLPGYAKPLPLNTRAPRQLQDVWLLGHPLGGLEPNYRNGVAPHALGGKVTQAVRGGMAFTDAHSTSGTSGGPMVDRRGRALGLHAIGVSVNNSAVTPYSGFLPMKQLARLLPALERGQGSPAEAGFSTEGLQVNKAAELKVRADAVWVRSLFTSGPAFAAGLRAGDVITGLTPPGSTRSEHATPTSVHNALSGLHTGARLGLQVLRPGADGAAPSKLKLQIGY